MQNSVLLHNVDSQTLMREFEEVKAALTDIQKRIAPPVLATVYLTREETADKLKVTLPTVWSYTKKGLLKSYRIGNQVRYIESEVMQAAKATGKTGNRHE